MTNLRRRIDFGVHWRRYQVRDLRHQGAACGLSRAGFWVIFLFPVLAAPARGLTGFRQVGAYFGISCGKILEIETKQVVDDNSGWKELILSDLDGSESPAI